MFKSMSSSMVGIPVVTGAIVFQGKSHQGIPSNISGKTVCAITGIKIDKRLAPANNRVISSKEMTTCRDCGFTCLPSTAS
jgi:hypothetical protein